IDGDEHHAKIVHSKE
ncbi:hypothetical protein JL09_g6438, partial [Pichia kudriavzevii]